MSVSRRERHVKRKYIVTFGRKAHKMVIKKNRGRETDKIVRNT